MAGCAKLPATISGRLLDTSNNPLLRCAAHETLNYRNSKSTQRLIFGSPNKTGCVRPETITGSHQLNRGGHGSGVESGRIRPAFPDPEPFDIFESSNSLAEVKTSLIVARVWTGVGCSQVWKNFGPGLKNFGTGEESENATPATFATKLNLIRQVCYKLWIRDLCIVYWVPARHIAYICTTKEVYPGRLFDLALT